VPQRPGRCQPPVVGIYLLLFVSVFAVYFSIAGFDFVNFDDPDYTGRPLSIANILWAFTAHDAANWFPVTRLTHLLDFTLFGAQAGPPHLINVALHAIASMLLFAFLFRAAAARWPSAFVAFLFALHPLHVESVAWIAERKDVLSACFAFLSLWLYAGGRRLLALSAFALGLMSKPMLVSLPLLLLLLDFWPLGRFRGWGPSLREKAPWFALSAISGAITWFAQQSGGAVRTLETFPLGLRIENALVSCWLYIAQTFWPVNLAVFYPYPQFIPIRQAALAFLALASVTVFVCAARSIFPYLFAGWLWFLTVLAPVIGIIQVGAQAHADRYMYIPMVGLGIMLAWGVPHLLPRFKPMVAALAALSLAACAAVSYTQLSYWQTSETLFRHAIAVTPANYLAEHNLGSYLLAQPGRLPDSVDHLRAALALRPEYPEAITDLASALAQSPGGLPEAITLYQSADRRLPGSAVIQGNLAQAEYAFGMSLVKQGAFADSIAHFEAALRLRPDSAEVRNNLGTALAQTGDTRAAEARFREAIRLKPDYADAHVNLGIALANSGHAAEALTELETANRLRPDPAVDHAIQELRRQPR
jgi:tetratricopeptide (TPR) repeat protein